MTRGRVRLIGRETGARALIRLPETFPANSSVQDMAISGTRLACVTNDGGLVVWDVPGDIEDDVQYVGLFLAGFPFSNHETFFLDPGLFYMFCRHLMLLASKLLNGIPSNLARSPSLRSERSISCRLMRRIRYLVQRVSGKMN